MGGPVFKWLLNTRHWSVLWLVCGFSDCTSSNQLNLDHCVASEYRTPQLSSNQVNRVSCKLGIQMVNVFYWIFFRSRTLLFLNALHRWLAWKTRSSRHGMNVDKAFNIFVFTAWHRMSFTPSRLPPVFWPSIFTAQFFCRMFYDATIFLSLVSNDLICSQKVRFRTMELKEENTVCKCECEKQRNIAL